MAREKTQDVSKTPAPEAPKANGWPKFLRSMTSFGYTDPNSNLHYSPAKPIKVDAAPQEGSWLHSQMAAGLIGEA